MMVDSVDEIVLYPRMGMIRAGKELISLRGSCLTNSLHRWQALIQLLPSGLIRWREVIRWALGDEVFGRARAMQTYFLNENGAYCVEIALLVKILAKQAS
jgi:hypothetical protein